MSCQTGNSPERSPLSSSSDDGANVQEVILKLDKVINLLQQQRSTITYIHQFGVWFLGVGVVFSFYYNYVLLEPILWSLFGVLFSYVALYPPKLKVLKFLVLVLGPQERWSVREDEASDDDDEEPCSTWQGLLLEAMGRYLHGLWRLVWFLVVPSGGDKESSVYFSILYRLVLVHLYRKTIVGYFPDITLILMNLFVTVSVLMVTGFLISGLRRSVVRSRRKNDRLNQQRMSTYPARSWTRRVLVVQDELDKTVEVIRVWLGRMILPHAHFISTFIVLLISFSAVSFLVVWTVYAFSDEVIWIYRNIASLVRALNLYLSHFSSYTKYVNKAYKTLSGWITSAVMADSASTKTRALYNYFSALSANGSNVLSESCMLGMWENCNKVGNATKAILAIVNQDLETLMQSPYCLVHGFWELTDYYREELQSGGTISRGGDYLLTALNYLKDILLQSSWLSFAAIGSGFTIFSFIFDSLLQVFIYITVLFLLLQSNVGLYRYAAVMLHFVDPSAMLYRSLNKALRAILISSIKMAVFHALFTWLLFSFFDSPLVVIPTLTAFLLGMVPVISPVVVAAIPLPIFVYASREQPGSAIFILVICFLVWWFVGTAIYAEIPDSSVWVTTFSVGLGISLFGPRGVVIGPAIATIPFALYSLGSAYINGGSSSAARSFIIRGSGSVIIPRLISTPTPSPARGRRDEDFLPDEEGTTEKLDELILGSSLVSGTAEEGRKRLYDFIMNNN